MTTTATRELLYREAINEAIRQEMERDETVIIMGEEIAGGAVEAVSLALQQRRAFPGPAPGKAPARPLPGRPDRLCGSAFSFHSFLNPSLNTQWPCQPRKSGHEFEWL